MKCSLYVSLFYIVLHASCAVQQVEGAEVADCEAGNVQLTGGPNQFEGRVEVCVNERWTQVCGNGGWGIRTSAAVCNQIIAGGNTTVALYLGGEVDSGYYSEDEVPVNFVNATVRCNARGLFNSCISEVHDQGCNNLYASVACPANCIDQSVRLATDIVQAQGLVEVCQLGSGGFSFWTGVCLEDLTVAAAMVICRQLGYLRANSSVRISSSPKHHRYTYSAVECMGNESSIHDCQLGNVQSNLGCNAALVNCQVFFESGTMTTESEVTSTQGEAGEPPSAPSSQDMLAIVVGAICGFIILVLLVTVVLLVTILLMRSRNKTRLKVSEPPTVDRSQPLPELLTNSPLSVPSQTNGLFGKLTVTNTDYHCPQLNDILAMPTSTGHRDYPFNTPQVQLSTTVSQTCVPEVTASEVHIYAEPSDPVNQPSSHDYAELEQCNHHYCNDAPAVPFPYELPSSAAGSRSSTMQASINLLPGDSLRTAQLQPRVASPESHQYAELATIHSHDYVNTHPS